jgi:DNA replication protein DnaC
MGDATNIGGELERILERGLELIVDDTKLARFHAEQAQNDRRERLEASGISERLDGRGAQAIVDDAPQATRALELVQAWLISPRPMLVLLGEPGQGKTVAAAWGLARIQGRYVRAQDLCDMRANWRERNTYRYHLRTGMLVLDELGTERDESAARDTLQDVVDARQRLPRRTLILGNLTKAQLVERYDKRTLSRLGVERDDDGLALLRSLKGADLRKAISK